MKTKLMAVMLLGAGAVCAQVSIGIRIGPPPPPRVVRVLPPSPGPEYMWIAGYWYPVGNHYKWHEGYYTRPAYRGATWIPPRHENQMYYNGYWKGDRGEIKHDHKWDKGRGHNRDYNHDREDRQ